MRKEKKNIDLDQIVYELCVPDTVWKRNPTTNVRVSLPASAMNRYGRAWNLFICASIMPSGHPHNVNVDRAILLFRILSREYVDIAYVIHQNILRFLKSLTGVAIPNATIETKLCTALGVRWSVEEQLQMPSAAIDHVIIERLPEWAGGIPHPRGWVIGISGEDVPGHHLRHHQIECRLHQIELELGLLGRWTALVLEAMVSVSRSIGGLLGTWILCMICIVVLLGI